MSEYFDLAVALTRANFQLMKPQAPDHVVRVTVPIPDLAADVPTCLWCEEPLSGNCEIRDETFPYCSVRCGSLARGV